MPPSPSFAAKAFGFAVARLHISIMHNVSVCQVVYGDQREGAVERPGGGEGGGR